MIAAIVLAAGTSSRYRAADPSVATKLVADLDGKPLVRHVAEAALGSRARPVVVVTGFAEDAVRHALAGLDLRLVHNSMFSGGLSTSLIAGLTALPADVAGALVLLGDMPTVSAPLLDRLIHRFETTLSIDAVVPVHGGRRGNPALLGRAVFEAAGRLAGDQGARRVLAHARVSEVEVGDDAVLIDIDEPRALPAGPDPPR